MMPKKEPIKVSSPTGSFRIILLFMFAGMFALSFVPEPNPQQKAVFDMLQRFTEVFMGVIAGMKIVGQ